jgi:phage terminase large subunit-like protein
VRDPATVYARSVVRGKNGRPVSRLELLCAQRHLDDVSHARARGLKWDIAASNAAIAFFSELPHTKGRQWAGQKFQPEPWQRFLIGSLFGWQRVDGTRRFRRAYVELPRKNGKSFLAAGVALWLAFFDGEARAEVYTAATKREQARLVFDEAAAMVKRTPDLKALINVSVGNLHSLASGSKLQPLGADADTTDGLNISGAIVDELHAHKTRAMVDVLDTATAARLQPLIFEITTAGCDRETVCWEHHDYAARLLEGVFEDDAWFVFLAGADPGDDWTDERTWQKANPNLGVSVSLDDLREKARKAERVPTDQNAFRRLHLNEWTEQEDRWLNVKDWQACNAKVDPDALRGRPCYVGLDLSATSDLTALSLAFPADDDAVDVLMRFWLPEARIALRAERRDSVPLESWVREGWLRSTPGNVVDYEAIRAELGVLARTYQIKQVGFDPWNATQLMTQLQGDGFECVEIRQGYLSLSAPTKALEARVLSKRIRHGGNPVLTWCASNVAVETDPAGNVKPSKKRAKDRIDGIVALIMALDLVNRAEPASDASFQMFFLGGR